MKILAVINEGGGKYHRIKLPLSYIDGVTFVNENELTEELISQTDILYLHWNTPISIPFLSTWQSTYDFKTVVDIDDTWELGDKYKKEVFQSQNLCLFADAVICTNNIIKQQIIRYNTNVHIIPNYLPNNGQFKFDRTFKEKEKVNICISGSISHYYDWTLLQKHIKKVIRDKELSSKINWYIIGYQDDQEWREIRSIFPKYTYCIPPLSVEEYMSAYKDMDIMLCPLASNNLSKGRSGLKIYEAAQAGVIPIIGDKYIEKDTLFKILPTNNWYNNIKSLVTNAKERQEVFDDLKIIRDEHDYDKECIIPRINILSDLLLEKQGIHQVQTNISATIFSIKYKPEQKVEYTPYLNTINTMKDKSYLFEYNPMIKLVREYSQNSKYFGIFSHKFPFKTGFYKKLLYKILNNEDSDIVVFSKQFKKYLEFTEQAHPGFLFIFSKICDKLGLKLREPKITVYSNFFVAKGYIYQQYVDLIEKAIDIIETDEEIKNLCWKDAGYKSDLTQEEFFKHTGLTYYTFHTFILERLLSIWIDNNKFKITIYN